MANYGWTSGTELYHYGIPGQKWGQRRYQNPDGSLTPEGRARYGRIAERHYKASRALSNYAKKHSGSKLGNAAAKAAKRQTAIGNSYKNSKSQNSRDKKIQTALKVGAAVAGTALAAYGGYKLGKAVQMNKGVKLGMTKATKNRIREENATKAALRVAKRRADAKERRALNREWRMTPAMKNAIRQERKTIRKANTTKAVKNLGYGALGAATKVGSGIRNAAPKVGRGIKTGVKNLGYGALGVATKVGSGARNLGYGALGAATKVGSGVKTGARKVRNVARNVGYFARGVAASGKGRRRKK